MRTTFKVHVHRHYVSTTLREWDSAETYTERCVVGLAAPAYVFGKGNQFDMHQAIKEVRGLSSGGFDTFPYPAFLDLCIDIPNGCVEDGITITSARYAVAGSGGVDFAYTFSGNLIPNKVRVQVIEKMLLLISTNNGDALVDLITSLIKVSGKRFEK